ncbi:hypothetical protein Tco_0181808 [Tanacetum coccineum]
MLGRPRKKKNQSYRHNKGSCKDPIVEQTPKPKGVLSRPRKKQLVVDVEDVDVVLRGPVIGENVGGSRGGASGSKGRGGAGVSRGGDGGSKGGDGGSKGGASGSIGGASFSRGGASVSKGGAGRSKRKSVSSAGTQKKTRQEEGRDFWIC